MVEYSFSYFTKGKGGRVGDIVKKIYVKTWGCSHNNSDSEYMAGQLAACGYKITGKCYGI